MEASTQTPIERFALESQIRECYGRVAYSHKTHEKMADRRNGQLRFWKWAQIILSGLTTAGAIGVIFARDTQPYAYATAAVSFVTLVVNSFLRNFDPGGAAEKHREAASELWYIREAYLSMLTDLRDPATALEAVRKRRDETQTRLHRIYQSSPPTDSKGYMAAQAALKQNEELTFSDPELDAFLPAALRRGHEVG